jgi:hypothetical protein
MVPESLPLSGARENKSFIHPQINGLFLFSAMPVGSSL